MNYELLGECAVCDKPILESEDWRIEKGEVCHKECIENQKARQRSGDSDTRGVVAKC